MLEPKSPAVRYDPSVEKIEPDEPQTVEGLETAFKEILEKTSADYGEAVRAVHAKAHGVLRGTLTVLPNLPLALAQGLFATPGEHDVIARFSTNAGDILDDSISLPRGLALKIFGADGARLPGSEGASTQDFVMVNGPAFMAPEPKAFLANLKMLAKTTDRIVGLKKAAAATAHVLETGLEAVGGGSAMFQSIGGAPAVHPLGETYYAQTPFRHGDYIAKYALVPVSPSLTRLTGEKIDAKGRPDAIREDVDAASRAAGGEWEFQVQLCTDLEAMPIEDASKAWDEDESPFVTVARLHVPAQASWTQGVTEGADKSLSFSPWHGLAAHQPLGGVNRVRKPAYDYSADFRREFNQCPMHEPRVLAEVPG